MTDGTAELKRVMAGEDLSREETERLFGGLMEGAVSEPVMAALLVALGVKGESIEEVTGAAAAMRRRAVGLPRVPPDAVDTCGTGGDGAGTFNISTAAALVAAAGGAAVAKHGNRSVSSRSGSADVLAALGVPVEVEPEVLSRCLEEVGLAFLFAPLHHPAMRRVMPVRRSLKVRTLFNLLGPLTNPAGARRQLMGIYDGSRVEAMARVLAELGAEHALVVHGDDGLDEITTTSETEVGEVRSGKVSRYRVTPERFGLRRVAPAALRGGSPEENAAMLEGVLAGKPGPLADVTALNAGAALYVGGRADTIEAGVARARTLLDTGAAHQKLDQLRAFFR